jgi:tetratricopeptide (TPR) repeat protein
LSEIDFCLVSPSSGQLFHFTRKCNIISVMNEIQKVVLRLTAVFLAGGLLSFRPHNISVTENYQNVQSAFEAGEEIQQSEALLEIASLQPWQRDLWETAGRLAHRSGAYHLAVEGLEMAKELGEISDPGQLILADAYRELGDQDAALEIWESLSGSAQAYREMAEIHEKTGEYQQAILDWESYLDSVGGGSQTEVYFNLGLLYALEDPEQASPYLKLASAVHPLAEKMNEMIEQILDEDAAYQLLSVGQVLAGGDQWVLAEEAFSRAADLRPDYPEAWAYWGESLQHIPNPESDPLEVLQRAQELDNNSALILTFMGLYYQRNGSHLTAIDYFQQARKSWPDQPDLVLDLGRSTAATGDLENALVYYQQAVDLSGESTIYLSRLAAFCVEFSYRVKDIGLSAARQAVMQAGEDPEALTALGEVLLDLEDELNAVRFFSRAVEADPDYAPAHLQLSLIYLDRGDQKASLYHLERVFMTSQNPALLDRAEGLKNVINQ